MEVELELLLSVFEEERVSMLASLPSVWVDSVLSPDDFLSLFLLLDRNLTMVRVFCIQRE